jgi:hypothetical protein
LFTVVDSPGVQLSIAMDALTTQYFKRFHRCSIGSIRENLESDS